LITRVLSALLQLATEDCGDEFASEWIILLLSTSTFQGNVHRQEGGDTRGEEQRYTASGLVRRTAQTLTAASHASCLFRPGATTRDFASCSTSSTPTHNLSPRSLSPPTIRLRPAFPLFRPKASVQITFGTRPRLRHRASE